MRQHFHLVDVHLNISLKVIHLEKPSINVTYPCVISTELLKFFGILCLRKMGSERPVWIRAQLFDKLPVFDRQSYSLEKLFQMYQESCTEPFRVGMPIFRELVRHLTTRGTMRQDYLPTISISDIAKK